MKSSSPHQISLSNPTAYFYAQTNCHSCRLSHGQKRKNLESKLVSISLAAVFSQGTDHPMECLMIIDDQYEDDIWPGEKSRTTLWFCHMPGSDESESFGTKG